MVTSMRNLQCWKGKGVYVRKMISVKVIKQKKGQEITYKMERNFILKAMEMELMNMKLRR